MESVRGRDVLFRSDTGAALSMVSQGYRVVQPGAVLDFFGKLAEAGGFTLETAGALPGGRRVWGLAKVHDGAPVVGHDVVRPYLLLATSYDGTMATTAKFTAIRVVCHNTLTMAASSASGAQTEQDGTEGPVVQCVRVPHMTEFQPEAVRQRLCIVLTAWERWLVEARLLALYPRRLPERPRSPALAWHDTSHLRAARVVRCKPTRLAQFGPGLAHGGNGTCAF